MPRSQASRQPLSPPSPSSLYKRTADRLDLSAEQQAQLETYVGLLGKWQPKVNLIGPSTWPDVWDRHVVDSLQCLDHVPEELQLEGRGCADIGTGAGFPGIVVAIATERPVTLVESDQRKAAFQLAVKTATGAPLTITTRRVEALPPEPIDVLFARAFAPLPRLLEWCAPLIDAETCLILHKGRTAAEEISAAAETHHFETESFPSLIDSDSVILRLRNVRPRR